MTQILNIFRKDVRHLWPQIAVIWALLISFDILEILSFPLDLPETHRINSLAGIVMLLLTLGIWYLVALAIYQEPLPGDRQFWLTKPYSRSKLLAEKALFMVVFINAPLFISDCFILGLQGFPVLSSIPQLLLEQLLVSTFFILPSFAIATVTRGVAQFVFAWFLIVLALIAQTMIESAIYRGGVGFASFPGWYAGIFLAAVAASIIVWQYAKRQTRAGRAVLIAIAFLGVPAIAAVSMLTRRPQPEFRSGGAANIHISYELGHGRRRSGSPSNGYVELNFPIGAEGLPPDTLLEGNGEASIEVGGKAWPQPGWHPATFIERSSGQYWQTMRLEASTLDSLKNRAANVESSFHLTLETDKIQTSIPVSERSFWVPHLGHCYSDQALGTTQLACRAGPGFHRMSLRIDEDSNERLNTPGFAEHSLPWGLSPTFDLHGGSESDLGPNARFDFIPRREIVTFQRALSLQNVDLTAYALGR